MSAQNSYLLAAAVGGYGPAWLGHVIFETNRPATFQYPMYSFIADWIMCWRALSGQLTGDFEKFGIQTTW